MHKTYAWTVNIAFKNDWLIKIHTLAGSLVALSDPTGGVAKWFPAQVVNSFAGCVENQLTYQYISHKFLEANEKC